VPGGKGTFFQLPLILNCYFCVLQDYGFAGRGIVAATHFKSGSFLLAYHGELINYKEGCQREKAYQKKKMKEIFLYFFKCNGRNNW
jgi:hypothetical protein